ncbi:von Willebrand factor type A domain-containing protein [Flavobacterium sp. NG2]|uniref:YfbK domain-containing protein n=1 Tax=Flavobacterium sp. NG2 TaxID=3097547 RepID=UPI002A7F8654|nr:von Willebrand factor type A domain-containing protein [Flavobacterium sp. NG2]WPR72897.1 von Willebrand factor type A domain-containing protein [Flavobacterium sp. NG2]
MKSQKLISLALTMFFSVLSFGQEITITGTVIDDTNLPLAGVSIIVKETQKGTQTDFNGKYSIPVKKGDHLTFAYIGYNSQTIKVGSSNVINVKMVSAANSLDEVVVVGYATQKKKDFTGSVMQVRSEAVERYSRSNAQQALQGKVAGVAVSANQVYASPSIMIRGISTTNGNNSPLYIIDGVPYENEPKLDPKNIKSVDVLKDASSSTIYGNRASNGVVMITTQNGDFKGMTEKELRTKLDAININPSPTPNQEDYENFVENQFETPKSAPLSTFSIDVDNASYTNIRRFINNGQAVPKDAVRIEEMMNFFKYSYPQPTDKHPFSINTEYSDCPWNPKHQLLKIGLQGKNIPTESLPASNLVFLIDVSGSMNSANKLPLLKQSLKILVNELRKEDKVAIVVYAGAAGLVLPPTTGDQKQTIIDALDKLNAGGSTAGGAGIDLAYKTALGHFIKGGNNRVILATDGDFNVGSSSNKDMESLIEEKRKSGVFLTCLGYGMGNYKDSKMEILANKGNGNYAYIDNIQEANRFLGKEFKGSMFAIAKDVKIQIEFNPKHVQSYRLIGYENRKLRPEDFKNDAIDAGELGSGHTVTALYEIIPTGIESTYSLPDLKYTNTTNVANYNNELATIKFRYKKPDGENSIEMIQTINDKTIALKAASEDFKFTTAVAWFGLKLRDSKLVSDKDTQSILALAKKGISKDVDGYKAELVRLVETVQ